MRKKSSYKNNRRVVITGLGSVTPAGIGVDKLWEYVLVGKSTERHLPEFNKYNMRSKIFCPVTDFEPTACGLDDATVERSDRFIQFALVAVQEAISQSRIVSQDNIIPHRIGVNIGTAVAGTGSMEQAYLTVTGGAQHPVSPMLAQDDLYKYMCPAYVSTEVASKYGFTGPSLTTSTGCTAGIDSIGYAFNTIRYGDADVMIAGASEAPIVSISIAAFDKISAITKKPIPEVGKASAPFSANRDGFVLAEGCGVLVLEQLEHALNRNALILAEVLSYSSTCNAYHMTGLPADGIDLSRAINLSLERANTAPHQINYINAHGSSTKQNDRNETAAYHRSFGEWAPKIPISSTKSILGHSLGSASSIEIIVCVKSILHNFLPPTINYNSPSEDCDLDYVPNRGRSQEVHIVLSNASGFSGLHSSIILKRYHS